MEPIGALLMLFFAVYLIWVLAAPVIVLYLQRRTDKLAGKISELEHVARTHVGSEFVERRIQSLLLRIEALEKRPGAAAEEPPAYGIELDEDAAESPAPSEVEVDLAAVKIGVPEAAAPLARTAVAAAPATERRAIDWERLLAEQWLAWLGGVALLFGLGFFLKYIIEAGLLGPTARVALGIVAGAVALVLGAHLMRRNYRYLGQALAGSGLGFWFLSLYAAHHWYGLIDLQTAFAGMIFATASTLLFSLIFDAEPVAVIALLGGFLAPVLLSTGRDDQWGLFSYLLLLDLAVLAAAGRRYWRNTELLSFLATVVMWILWYDKFYSPEKLQTTIVLASLFYLLFALLGVVHHLIHRRPLAPSDAALILATPVAYFAMLYQITQPLYADWQGLMAAAMAMVYVGLWTAARKRNPSDQALRECLFGLATSFFVLAVPLYWTGYWIAILWTGQAVLLVRMGLTLESARLRAAGFALLGLVHLILLDYGARTLYDPATFHASLPPGGQRLPIQPFLNGRSMSFLAAAAALAWLAWEYRRRPPQKLAASETRLSGVLFGLSPMLFLATLMLETLTLGATERWPASTTFAVNTIWAALIVAAAAWLACQLRALETAALAMGMAVLLVVMLSIDFGSGLAESNVVSRGPGFTPPGFALLAGLFATGGVALAFINAGRPDFDGGFPAARHKLTARYFGLFAVIDALAFGTVETVVYAANHQWFPETRLAALTLWVAGFVMFLAWLSVRMRSSYSLTLSCGVGGLLVFLLLINFATGLVDAGFMSRQLKGELGFWGWFAINPRGLAMLSGLVAAWAVATALVRGAVLPGRLTATALKELGLIALLNGLAFLTVELVSHGNLYAWGTARSLAVTCAWSLYASACLAGGIQRRSSQLRLFALALFLATTGKVFLHDLWYLHAVIRYIAFTVLGIALLSASFLYRRFEARLRDWIGAASSEQTP